jgi:hypothetical protein
VTTPTQGELVSRQIIEVDPNEPLPDPDQTARGTRSYRLWQLIVAAVLAAATGAIVTLMVEGRLDKEQGRMQGVSTYQPKTDQEKTLFSKLRPANFDEVIALTQAQTAANASGSTQFYIAQDSITLPQVAFTEPIVIGLPEGKQWLGGPLLNTILVLADPKVNTPVLALREGNVLYDSHCYPRPEAFVAASACTAEGQQPATMPEMLSDLRLITDKEQAEPKISGPLNEIPFYLQRGPVYYAARDVRLAPFLGREEDIPVIVLGENAKIVGGRLGRVQVVSEIDISAVPGPYPAHAVFSDPVYASAVFDSENLCAYMAPAVRQMYPDVCK